MFGIVNNLNDHSLYLLNDMVENKLKTAEQELLTCNAEHTERITLLTRQIAYHKHELNKFRDIVEEQRKDKFQFSVEELYAMYGQFENKYISIEFHKYSESAAKYGRNIAGVIVYFKAEREDLDALIKTNKIPRTNGAVKIDFSKSENLSDALREDLLNNGFPSGDIYQILASDYPIQKTFNIPGKKEIPNTIEIKIDPTQFDPNKSSHWLLSQKVKSGYTLTEFEWDKFCALSIYLEPDSIEKDNIQDHAFHRGTIKSSVRFFELQAKLYSEDIAGEEIIEFGDFLKQRKTVRIDSITQEIKRSTNKTLDNFKKDYPEIYEAIETSIIQFEDETIVYHNAVTPIYWDYEGFLHIYLRHCDELEIEGHFKNKTKFQYSQKNIKRILAIAIKKLLPQINARLNVGKEFRVWGDKSLYFNGNHYSLHILPDGRVAAFHPLENPTT